MTPQRHGRVTIGLYNSYDPRRFTEAHRRALVRAAPLALAFDANLAAFGFPFADLAASGGRTAENRGRGADGKRGQGEGVVELRTPVEVARYVASTTSVAGAKGEGDDASSFVRLAEAGRFSTFELPKKGFPPQLGAVVLTTEHAEGAGATTARAVARELHAGRSQLLVFGLGPHGTPPEVRAVAVAELDITRAHVGLETATAMGAVLGAVHAHLEALDG